MGIIQFHTPQGIVEVDSETATDEELAELNITRDALNDLIPSAPSHRDLAAEIDELKVEIEELKKK